MKDSKLRTLMKLCSNANVLLLVKENLIEIISFNNYSSTIKFKKVCTRKGQHAFFEHLDNLKFVNTDHSNYLNCLQKQMITALNDFFERQEWLTHKNIEIFDQNERTYRFNDLPDALKKQISDFIAIQRSTLNCFISRLTLAEEQIIDTNIRWNGSKTDLIELATALYDGGFVNARDRKLTKKEFMEHMSVITGVDTSGYPRTIAKALLRDDPATFLHQLIDVINLKAEE